MQITVELGLRSYPVFINQSHSFPRELATRFAGRPCALITNTTIARIYAQQIAEWKAAFNPVIHVIEDGERYKTLATWQAILDTLLDSGLDRKAVVIAMGGGVVGDIAGFAAASFLRGVDFVQVPTTLLAMVDSSVGGKTGVDHPSGKNRIGAFHQPRMVWIDTRYLDTLPERQFIAGYAEIFKYAFIGGADMFSFIENSHERILAHDAVLVNEAIERSVRIKATVVAQDEREAGLRALLNFGHTFAHALERFYNYEQVLHGEAVFWGMACALDLAIRTGTIAPADRDAFRLLQSKLIAIPLPSRPDARKLYAGMFTDKKAEAGKLRFVLPVRPGESVVRGDINGADVAATLHHVLQSHSGVKG